MTRHTPTELREMARICESSDYELDVAASMLRQAADDAERIARLESDVLLWRKTSLEISNQGLADEEDAKRMQFVEDHPGWLRVSRLGHRTKQRWLCDPPFKQDWMDTYKTAREAIDAARKEPT